MSFDEIFDLTAGVYFNFYNIYNIYYNKKIHSSWTSCEIEDFVETHIYLCNIPGIILSLIGFFSCLWRAI